MHISIEKLHFRLYIVFNEKEDGSKVVKIDRSPLNISIKRIFSPNL